MPPSTLTGTYNTSITLTYLDTTVATTGVVSVTNADALFGNTRAHWSVTNYGTVTDTGTIGSAIHLAGSGYVTNEANAVLKGAQNGVLIDNAGTVINRSTIAATGTGPGSSGVVIDGGGSLVNGQSGSTSGTISGLGNGVVFGSTTNTGTLTNYGKIAQYGSLGDGVSWNLSGTLRNEGTISERGTTGAAVNFGTAGATLINGQSGSTAGLITGYENGVAASLPGTAPNIIINYGDIQSTETTTGSSTVFAFGVIATGTVENFGTIVGDAAGKNSVGVQINNGGRVVNGSSTATAATVSGGGEGVAFDVGSGTLVNYGTITASVGAAVNVFSSASAQVTNFGMISGLALAVVNFGSGSSAGITNHGTIEANATADDAIYLGGGGTITNYGLVKGARAPTGGTSGFSSVIITHNEYATIRNFGTVAPTNVSDGINLDHGGTIVNGSTSALTATISAGETGIYGGGHSSVAYASGAAAFITNYGTIRATGTATGIRLVDGGSITNEASGLISAGGDGISIGAGAETVSNRGTIVSTGTFDSAVFLGDGGLVTNGARNATSALIDGLWIGVDFKTVIGTVDNLGTIESTATFSNPGSLAGVSGTLLGVGVIMQQGGTLTNGVSGSNVGLITGYALGVYIGGGSGIPNAGAAGTVFNYGTILSTGTNGVAAAAVELSSGGTVTNFGLIDSAGKNAILLKDSAGTVLNYGTIRNGSNAHGAIYLGAGGKVTNGSATQTAALIDSPERTGISIENVAATVDNFGVIESGAPASATAGAGVYLQSGGTITNEATGVISADRNGVTLGGTVATSGTAVLTNLGNITGDVGVVVATLDSGANTIVDAGTITGTGGTAVSFEAGADTLVIDPGSVLNGSVAGFVLGDEIDFADKVGNGTAFANGVLSLTENGTTVASVALSGSVASDEFAVSSDGHGGTAVTLAPPPSALSFAVAADDGTSGDTFTVAGMGAAGDTVTLYDGTTAVGTATVGGGGTWSITTAAPLGIGAHNLTAKEADSAGGQSTASAAELLTVNSATPNGVTFLGTAGVDNFTGGAGNDIFEFSAANLAATDTVVGGGGSDELLMTTAGTINAGGVSGVEIYDLANGGANTLTPTSANFAGVTGGRITVNGGSGGNTINATALTASELVDLEGGAGNDTFEFSAAGLAAGDTVVGGGGTDHLIVTTAGTIKAGGVSGVEIYDLANGGANTLTLTNANFTGVVGGTITVNGGSGGNTVNASAVTGSNQVILVGGAGTDTFTGGTGGATFKFSAANLAATDTVVGGGGTDRLVMTTAGTISAEGVSGVEVYDLANSGANTLTLTNANFTGVTGATITVNSGNTVNASALTGSNRVILVGGAGTDTFTGGAGNDTFKFSAGNLAATDTVVGGGGSDELLMTTAGTVNAGGVSGVEIYDLANGGPNGLTLTNANFAGVTGNLITVNGGSGGNTIDASGLTGSNQVKLEGGAGNDVFDFSATSLTAADTVVGGGGTDHLIVTTAGTVNAGGVSGVEIYDLANGGANTLTLTNANFAGVAGGRIVVNGGNDGNTIDATALTASDLVDLIGGVGDDTFEFSAASLAAGDEVVGGGGTDHLIMTTAGTINAGGVSGVGIYDLDGGGANTLTLTSANFAGVTGGRITVNGGSGGNTINAAALTGTDLVNLIGGAGDDTFEFSAAGLAAGDEVVGGGGSDELLMTTAGTINAGGVSGVETYDLANGGPNGLTLTNANFAGVTGSLITVNGGSGGNTINVSALTGSDLVKLEGGAGNDSFDFSAASLLAGDTVVGGGGTDHLVMTTAGTINAGRVSGVGIYDLANGGANTLTLTNANFAGVAGGRIVVNGGNDGNTIDATALTASDLVDLIGGVGDDTFEFSATSLAAGDEVVGGGGSDELLMTTAGTINAGGVSGVETYDLANGGADTLTLTTANFTGVTGGRITVNGGSGGNTFNAAALTASDLVNLIGGAGDDTFEFSAAGLAAGDEVVGGGGSDELLMTTAGTINAGGVSGVETYDLANGGPNGLTLTNANFAGVTGSLITVNGGSGGNTINVSALTGSDLVKLEGGAGNDTFEFSAASLLAGDTVVGGGGTDHLVMTTAGTINAGGVSGVGIYDLAGGGANTLTLTTANFAGVTGGLITVNGGSGGNTIDASALTGSDQVKLEGGAGNDVFDFSATSLTAADTVVGGGGGDELLMTTAGTINAGGVSGVETYDLTNGGTNTLTLTNANFAGVTGSTITVNAGNGSNFINAAAVTGTNQAVLVGGAGMDVFTGGAGNDVFEFSAANLAATDTVVGGAGSDELLMDTAGAVNAEGVSGVEAYVLANGGPNSLILTNANFAGVTGDTITVDGGSGGNNIYAAAVIGADHVTLNGGAGNDVLTAGQDATMTGGGGDDIFALTTPGTLSSPDTNTITDFNSSTDEITFSDAGFGLGLSGANSTPTALPSTLFTSNSTGSFIAAAQRFAYDTGTGALYYDSQGNTVGSTSLLVATLTGQPTLTASNLFFTS